MRSQRIQWSKFAAPMANAAWEECASDDNEPNSASTTPSTPLGLLKSCKHSPLSERSHASAHVELTPKIFLCMTLTKKKNPENDISHM